MTTQTDIQWIPLKDLARSDSNVRATPASADAMRELEASIDAHGLIENLVVRPTPNAGKPYRVTAGERRLEALKNLARKRKSAISPTTPIPCRVLGPNDVDEEVSLAENVMRVAMHPVDQYTAFRKLLDRGLDARAIANRFGLTARTVQRRLRLGEVAPEILAEAKDDRLSLEQLEAFASTPDRARQVEVWTKMRNQRAYTPAAGWIRNELQRQLLSAASPRVRFVGLKAYRDAGGTLEEDLFAAEDESRVHVCDVRLLDELASKKLDAAKRKLGRGWRWIDTRLEADWDVARQFGRLKGAPQPPSASDHARLARVAEEIDRLKERAYALDDDTEDAEERARLTARMEELEADAERIDAEIHSRENHSAEQKACSGCIVTIDDEGKLLIHRGLVRREDEHLVPRPAPATAEPPEAEAAPTGQPDAAGEPAAQPSRDDAPAAAEPPPAPPEPPAGEPPAPDADEPPPPPDYDPPRYEPAAGPPAATREAGLGAALADDLRRVRTALVKAHLEADFTLAFDLAACQMAAAVFGDAVGGPTSIEIDATPDVNPDAGVRERLAADSPGARMLAESAARLELDWLREPDPAARFRAFRELPETARRALFAGAVARALRPQLALDPDARPETEALVEALEIPFEKLYRPTLEGFWMRMGRREMLAVAAGTLGNRWEEAHASDRKETLAAAMAAAFGPDDPPAAAGVTPSARASALAWTPPGFRPHEPADPEPAPADDAGAPSEDVPAWLRD